MIKNNGTGGDGGVGPAYIANGGAGCESGPGVCTPGSGGSGGNGRFIWSRTEDGREMRIWQNEPTCCQTHNLLLVQKRGTEIYHKCYVCGRDWTEPVFKDGMTFDEYINSPASKTLGTRIVTM
nr:MAG TPA: hypothetical protein [Caudoviricetes sp.]